MSPIQLLLEPLASHLPDPTGPLVAPVPTVDEVIAHGRKEAHVIHSVHPAKFGDRTDEVRVREFALLLWYAHAGFLAVLVLQHLDLGPLLEWVADLDEGTKSVLIIALGNLVQNLSEGSALVSAEPAQLLVDEEVVLESGGGDFPGEALWDSPSKVLECCTSSGFLVARSMSCTS